MRYYVRLITWAMVIGFVFAVGGFSQGWTADEVKKININTASAEELAKLKGVGPAIAKKIIEYREKNGPFKAVNDLANVKGIGPKILSNNINIITTGNPNETAAEKPKDLPIEKAAKTQ